MYGRRDDPKTVKLSLQAREKQTPEVYQNARSRRKKARPPRQVREDGDINGISLGDPTHRTHRHHQSPRMSTTEENEQSQSPDEEQQDSESLDSQLLLFIDFRFHRRQHLTDDHGWQIRRGTVAPARRFCTALVAVRVITAARRPMNSTRTVAASMLSLFPTASQKSWPHPHPWPCHPGQPARSGIPLPSTCC